MDTLRTALKPYLDDLRERRLTNREVARRLNVTEAHLSRTLKAMKVEKVPSDAQILRNQRAARRTLEEARKEFRNNLPTDLSVAQAARLANCHPRTIYRIRNGK